MRAYNHDVADDVYHQRPDDKNRALVCVCGEEGVAKGGYKAKDINWGSDEERYGVVELRDDLFLVEEVFHKTISICQNHSCMAIEFIVDIEEERS